MSNLTPEENIPPRPPLPAESAWPPPRQFYPVAPPAQPTSAPSQKKPSFLGTVVATAAVTALLASGGTYAAVKVAEPGNVGNSPQQQEQVVRETKVIASTAWGDVIREVQGSVVALRVALDNGSGGSGSGVILTADGLIATNNHVVESANELEVTLSDGRIIPGTVVGRDPSTDVAVVKLSEVPEGLTAARLANSDEVLSGDEVLAMGNPLGLSQTATTGIVSALQRPTTTAQDNGDTLAIVNALQIDASVNPGNSGGPVFNANGEVVGLASSIARVPSAGLDTTAGSIGIGFAIPSNVVKYISDQLIESGEAQHGRIGAVVDTATATTKQGTFAGARIRELSEGSSAAAAGLQENDVIVKFAGKPITSSSALTGYVRITAPEEEAAVEFVRNGQLQELTVTVANS